MTTLTAVLSAKTLNDILDSEFVVSRFSTDGCMILVSKDSTAKVVIEKGQAKVYSCTDNKKVLHVVSTKVDVK